jgi:hypothetical protein
LSEILGDKNSLQEAALQAIILAIIKSPEHRTTIMKLFALDSSIPSSFDLNEFNQSIGPDLIAGASIFYDDILRELVDKVIQMINSKLQVSA